MDDMATEVGSSEERDDISEGTTIVESKAIGKVTVCYPTVCKIAYLHDINQLIN